MTNTKSLLTVAIPTYNRSKQLKVILDQLVEQKSANVEVIVADDQSPDDTEAVVKEYLKELPTLTYVKNENNLGFSKNVSQLYNLSKTRYIWFLCDDDEITPGALEEMLRLLAKHEPTVAVFNHLHVDPYGRDMNAGVETDKIYNDVSELNDYQPLMRTTFLSTLVVEKLIPLDKIVSRNYEDNVYFQVTLALQLLSKKFKYAEFSFPITKRHVGFKYGDFFKFYMVDHLKAIHLIEHSFDNSKFTKWSIKDLPNAFKLYYSQKLGLYTYQKQPSKETLRRIVEYYKVYSLLIFGAWAAYYVTPKFLVKLIYALKLRKIHGNKKGKEIYLRYIDRAFKDKRKTGFTNYR